MRATITIYAVGLRYDGVVKQKEAIGGLVYAVAETWHLVWGDEKLLAHLIFLIFTVLNLVYDHFFKRKTTFSENNFLMTLFFTLFILSRTSDNTTSKHIGGTEAWESPTSNFWGTVSPVPLGLRL